MTKRYDETDSMEGSIKVDASMSYLAFQYYKSDAITIDVS